MGIDQLKLAHRIVAHELSADETRIHVRWVENAILVQIDSEVFTSGPATSHRTTSVIGRLKKLLQSRLCVTAQVAVASGELQTKLEDSLKTLLNNRFPGLFADAVTSSVGDDNLDVSLIPYDAERELSAKQIQEVSSVCSEFLALAGMQPGTIGVVGYETPQPTSLVLLRHIKILQPVTVSELTDQLRNAEFRVTSTKWLQHQIDSLRQKGFVCFAGPKDEAGDFRYALTALGLDALPSQVGRTASDVLRALALRNKKW